VPRVIIGCHCFRDAINRWRVSGHPRQACLTSVLHMEVVNTSLCNSTFAIHTPQTFARTQTTWFCRRHFVQLRKGSGGDCSTAESAFSAQPRR
jgi:hypothetical protein